MRRAIRICIFGVIVFQISLVSAEEANRYEAMRALYAGPEVKRGDQLEDYRGVTALGRIVGLERQQAVVYNYEQMCANYGFTVDFQLRQEQVILCPQTKDYLYEQFTPMKLRYQRGERPGLEAIVDKVTAGLSSDQEKALALMRFCRDLKKKERIPPGSGYIYGGTEEYLIEHGTNLCEVLGRLFAGLCEIAGIPARVVMHDIGGHITAEAYLDGHWGYIDPRFGLYYRKDDGQLASVWELWLNPAILWQQNDAVKADIGGPVSWEQRTHNCETKYFHLKEVNAFENYSLMDAGRYCYRPLPFEEAVANGVFLINKAYRAASGHIFGLTADNVYFVDSRFSDPFDPYKRHYGVKLPEVPALKASVLEEGKSFKSLRSYRLRIIDPIDKAFAQESNPQAILQFYTRQLEAWETIEVYVNSQGPGIIPDDFESIVPPEDVCPPAGQDATDWCVYGVIVDPKWLWPGENIVRFVYSTEKADLSKPLEFFWMDLKFRCEKQVTAGLFKTAEQGERRIEIAASLRSSQ